MRTRYAAALTVLATYFIASYFVLHYEIGRQRDMALATSVAGQQRMHSQRIVMFADAVVTSDDASARKTARANLEATIHVFRQAHIALSTGDPLINPAGWPSRNVRSMYFDEPLGVDRQVRTFVDHARAFDARIPQGISASDPDLRYLLSVGPGPLLQSLDAVVRRYNADQQAAIANFETIELSLLGLGLATLAGVWFMILLPLERENAAKTAALERTASIDSLTQVYNRAAFAERVEAALANARRAGNAGAMLMIDLDRFKRINDYFGHLAGDKAIAEAAKRLRATVRDGEFITRLGGDEFAIYAPSVEDLGGFVDRLTSTLQFRVPYNNAFLDVTASIGVAHFPHDGETLDSLLAAADRALYAAKSAGRATYSFATA